jgi:hypothetical protein
VKLRKEAKRKSKLEGQGEAKEESKLSRAVRPSSGEAKEEAKVG